MFTKAMTDEDETPGGLVVVPPVVAVQLLPSLVAHLAGGEEGGDVQPDNSQSV